MVRTLLHILGIFIFVSNYSFGNSDNVSISDTSELRELINKGNTYLSEKDIDKATPVLGNLTEYFEDGSNHEYTTLVSYWRLRVNYYLARKDLFNQFSSAMAMKNIIRADDSENQTFVNHKIAIILYTIRDFKTSIDYFKENRKIAEGYGEDKMVLYSYYGIADSYSRLKNHTESKKVCFKALAYSNKSGVTQSIGFVNFLLGGIYIEESKLDSARYYLEKGLKISELQNDTKEILDNKSLLAHLEMLNGNIDLAQKYAEDAIISEYIDYSMLCDILARIHLKKGNDKLAIEYQKKNIDFQQELIENNSVYDIVSDLLSSKNEQEKQLQLNNQRERFQKTKIGLITAISIFLILGLLLITYLQNKNQRKVNAINSLLEEKNKNLEDFSFISSHDLKEPITNIFNYTNLIKSKLEEEQLQSNYEEYFQFINKETKQLNKIVSSLKIYTQINTIDFYKKSHFSIINLIENAISQFQKSSDIEITFNHSIGNEDIYNSKKGLVLIVQNLIDNAIKHNDKSTKKINIECKNMGKEIFISVKDNGPGIAEKYEDHIFQPFKTLKNKSSTNSAGMGLAICKRILKEIGGKMWIESDVNRGTSFCVSFPR